MDMIGKIRRLHRRDKLSEREIARKTGLSRNTVSKWLKGETPKLPKYVRGEQATKLTPFHDAITQALKADARRPRKERRTAKALFAEIKAAGYDGGYSRLTDFIRAWREGEGAASSAKAFVPLTFELGEAFQFDWSEEGLVVGGIYYRVQVAHMKLCASRAFWLVAYPSQGHEMLFDAHNRCFAALGGVARRGIYDNMKTAVDRVRKGKGRTVNARFAVMCAHYLYDPDFCNVAAGWEKGVVEKNVQDSRRRIWIEATKRRFGRFAELNACRVTGIPTAIAHIGSEQECAVDERRPAGLDQRVPGTSRGAVPRAEQRAALWHAVLGRGRRLPRSGAQAHVRRDETRGVEAGGLRARVLHFADAGACRDGGCSDRLGCVCGPTVRTGASTG